MLLWLLLLRNAQELKKMVRVKLLKAYMFWALFINSGTSIFLPVCKLLTGDKVLFDGLIQYVDALVISLPLSIVVMAVSLFVIRSKARSAQVQDVQEKTAVAE